MISHQYFKAMPKNGVLLKDVLNWFVLGYKNMYKHSKKQNHYYSSSIEIGYCGSDLCEFNEENVEISLIHSGSWGFETFEQVSISIPTQFKTEFHESFFVQAHDANNFDQLINEIKENPIFIELMSSEISGHEIFFGEHDG